MNWMPVYRYRHGPWTLVILTCGHQRIIDHAVNLVGATQIEATCQSGCWVTQYVTSAAVIW